MPTSPVPPARTPSLAALLLAVAIMLPACARTVVDRPTIDQILRANPAMFAAITARAEEHRIQVLLSEVITDSRGRATLARSTFRADAEYFYPASTIKLCAAVAAFQAIEAMNTAGPPGVDHPPEVTTHTPLVFHPLFPDESIRERDATNLDGEAITVGHEIRKLFLVSDNDSFNRLYEFVGQRELNEAMLACGLHSTRISHRLAVGRTAEQNRRTRRIDLLTTPAPRTIPERTSDMNMRNPDMPGLRVGDAFMAGGGKIIAEPMDFQQRNRIGIVDLQDLLIMLARPDIDLGRPGVRLSEAHRTFLLDAMAEYPGDSANPRYERDKYSDEYGKFFLPGLLRVGGRMRDELTIRNKVGQAYGFTIDNAAITDHRTGREFFLTAVIYTNADGVLNNDRYEYDAVAFPFMADLAEAVAEALWSGSAAPGATRR